MTDTFKKIDALQKRLESLQPLPLDIKQKLDKKFRLEFNFNSNHIEGNTLSYNETELLLIFDKTTGNHAMREYEEMKAHDVAFDLIKEWADDEERSLSESDIKNLHKILLVRPFWKEAQTSEGQTTRREILVGNYKQQPNNVRLQNGEIFQFASVIDTPILMEELMSWYRKEEKSMHPAMLAAILHYRFVHIHPFDDGNGRLSRLLMNYVLIRHGLPPVVIKAEQKKKYLFALNQADTGNIDAFVQFIAQQLVWSLDISIKAAKGENIDETEDFDKKMVLLKRKLGEKPETTILLIYSLEALNTFISNALIPLAIAWEQKLKSFETLFLSRNAIVTCSLLNLNESAFTDAIFNPLKKMITSENIYYLKNTALRLKATFTGLRNVNNELNFNCGEITVTFFDNAYELKWLNEPPLNRLYHQGVTEVEIEKIASDLGNWFHKNVEEKIEKLEKKN